MLDAIASWFVDKVVPPAVVAVVFTFLTNMVMESHRAQRDVLTSQIQILRDDLLKLWEAGSAYWSRSALPDDTRAEHGLLILEQDIRTRAMELAPRLDPFLPQHRMLTLTTGLIDAFTGGDFGNPDRAADLERLTRMREMVVTMRAELLSARAASLQSPFRVGH